MAFFAKILDKILHRNKPSLKHVFALFSFVFVVWTIYRYFPEILPTWAEELILKPLIWLPITFWLVLKVEKNKLSSLGLTAKNLFPSIYWGIGLGIVYALEGFLANILKYGGVHISQLGYTPASFFWMLVISFATAFTEELVFRGYIYNRLVKIWGKEWLANLVSSLLFVLIHLPVGVFVLGYTPVIMLIYLLLVFIYAIGSGFVLARTNNLMSSILLHVFWSWPIILFK